MRIASLIIVSILLWPVKGIASDQPELTKVVESIVHEYTKRNWFGGTVYVSHNGQAIFHTAYGYANRNSNISNGINTRYNLGSIAKDYTSVLVLQQIETGKLSLNDTLSKFDLGFAKSIAAKITIRHLLQHTSGFKDIFTAQYRRNQLAYDTVQKRMRLLLDSELLFEPGSDHRYSNYNFTVLGAILEKVTGDSFPALVRSNIIARLKLQNTQFVADETDPMQSLRYSYGYAGEPKYVGVTELAGPSGGIESSSEDLAFFFHDLFYGNQLLTKPMVRLFKYLRGRTNNWQSFGGGAGVSSAIEMDVKSGLTVVVLANTDKLVAERISGRIIQFVEKGGYDPIKDHPETFAYSYYQKHGAKALKENFNTQFQAAGYQMFIGRPLNEVGMGLTRDGKFEQAMDFFNTLIHLFPKAPQAYDSAAWGLFQSGQKKQAKEMFLKAKALNVNFNSDYEPTNYGLR